MELAIHKSNKLACLAQMLAMWVDQDMSIANWMPRYFTEFTCGNSISGAI